jgi:hypothetical protein
MFESGGALIGEHAAEAPSHTNSLASAGAAWSPGSVRFAYGYNGWLFVLDRSGLLQVATGELQLPQTGEMPFLLNRWVDDETIECFGRTSDGDPATVLLTVADGGLLVAAIQPGAPSFAAHAAGNDPNFARIAMAHPDARVTDAGPTADGRGTYYRLDVAPRANRADSTLVVVAGGEDHQTTLSTRDGVPGALSVVLVGDWLTP